MALESQQNTGCTIQLSFFWAMCFVAGHCAGRCGPAESWVNSRSAGRMHRKPRADKLHRAAALKGPDIESGHPQTWVDRLLPVCGRHVACGCRRGFPRPAGSGYKIRQRVLGKAGKSGGITQVKNCLQKM